MTEHNEHQTFKTDEIPCQEISDPVVLSKNPLVGVHMITYNHEPYIAQAIEGVLMQKTDFPIELIIGEDCSTDRTREIVLDYQKKYPEIIRVITSDKNVGANKNFLRTEKACRGKYVAICEGDDYWTDERKLQKQITILEENPSFSSCFHNALVVNLLNKEKKPFITGGKKSVFGLKDLLLRDWFVPTASLVFRRDLLPPILPEWYFSVLSGDLAIELMLSTRGNFAYIDKIMSVYRRNTPYSCSANQPYPYFWLEKKLSLLKGFKSFSADVPKCYYYLAVLKTRKELLTAKIYNRFPFVYRLKEEVKEKISAAIS